MNNLVMHKAEEPVTWQRRRPADGETLLLVDDSPENLLELGDLLADAGYRVRVANCGRVALKLAVQTPRPSLILLDITMPEMDGHEVLQHLRSNSFTHDIPVIFLTAHDTVEDEERAFDAGIVDYIVKPIDHLFPAREFGLHESREFLRRRGHHLEAQVGEFLDQFRVLQRVHHRRLQRVPDLGAQAFRRAGGLP